MNKTLNPNLKTITVTYIERPTNDYEASHPIQIEGIGSGNQKLNFTLEEANSLCDQLAKATLICGLKQMTKEETKDESRIPLTMPDRKDVYVKAGACESFKDGGTEAYKSWDGKKYFVDYRINTKTYGKVYDLYPGDKGAQLLAVRLIETNVPPDPDDDCDDLTIANAL